MAGQLVYRTVPIGGKRLPVKRNAWRQSKIYKSPPTTGNRATCIHITDSVKYDHGGYTTASDLLD